MMPWPYIPLLVGMIAVGSSNAATQDRPEAVRSVSIDVGDLMLGAKLYPGRGDDPRPAIVLLHGWTWPQNEPSWGLVSAAREFQQSGYTVLVPSMRGWPPTGGRDDCAGQQVSDVLEILEWLGRQTGIRADARFLAGYSQGGQVALLAASRDAPVKAVAAFAPVTDPRNWGLETDVAGIRDYVMEECGGPDGWRTRSVLNRVDRLRVPVLLVHGEADRRVPTGQSTTLHRRLTALQRPVQLRLVPGVGHDQDDVLQPRLAIDFFRGTAQPVD